MHNLNHDTTTAETSIADTKKNLHMEKRKRVDAQSDAIKNAYDSFLSNTVPCELERVSSTWPLLGDNSPEDKERQEIRDIMYNLYEAKRTYIKHYRDRIESLNGGRMPKCPLCGVTTCKQLDHYIPREKMPEFSVFTPNLIPLCADCNKEKGTKWLNGYNERLIFNAFFDRLPHKPVCVCSIKIDDHGLPQAIIELNPALDVNNPLDRRILTTEHELDLVNRVWQPECNEVFNNELTRLELDYDAGQWPNPKDYWVYKSERIPNYLDESMHTSFIAKLVYMTMGSSQVIGKWLCAKLRKM